MRAWLTLVLVTVGAGAVPTSAATREVLAHGSAERMWVGRYESAQSAQGDVDRTNLLLRAAGPGQRWKTLAMVPSKARALASRDGQAVVLLGDGQWMSVWSPDGAATGTPLPNSAQIVALGDDGNSLWAVGAVPGGWAALHTPSTKPTTRVFLEDDAVMKSPTTAPATRPDGPPGDVVFHLLGGQWTPGSATPASGEDRAGGALAITAVDDHVYLASAVRGGNVNLAVYTPAGGWASTRSVAVSAVSGIDDLQWVTLHGVPELWVSDGHGPGWLLTSPLTSPTCVKLNWNGKNSPTGPPAIAVAGGFIRLVGLYAGTLYEQRYEPNGSPVGEAAELAVPVDVQQSPLQRYINFGLLGALLLSTGATMYRRSTMPNDANWTPPAPAPLLARAGAGLIDALPVLVTLAIVSIRTDPTRNALDRLQQLPALIATGGSIAFYIMHTTVSELLTRRTLGKWVFGLRAVSINGTRATVVQVLLRNGLRVIDVLLFPLVIAVISPLRQRSADIAAGTMVIRDGPISTADKPSDPASVNTTDER